MENNFSTFSQVIYFASFKGQSSEALSRIPSARQFGFNFGFMSDFGFSGFSRDHLGSFLWTASFFNPPPCPLALLHPFFFNYD